MNRKVSERKTKNGAPGVRFVQDQAWDRPIYQKGRRAFAGAAQSHSNGDNHQAQDENRREDDVGENSQIRVLLWRRNLNQEQ